MQTQTSSTIVGTASEAYKLSDPGHINAEVNRLNHLLAETHARTVTLAKFICVPTTTIEQLPALVESITNYLKFNIVHYTPGGEFQESLDDKEFGQTAEQSLQPPGNGGNEHEPKNQKIIGGFEKEVESDSQATIECIQEYSESDSQSTKEDGDGEDGDGEDGDYQESDSANEDTDVEIKILSSTPKRKDDHEEDDSTSASINPDGPYKCRGGPYSQRKIAQRAGKPSKATSRRYPVYQQKQILLSPEPEGE